MRVRRPFFIAACLTEILVFLIAVYGACASDWGNFNTLVVVLVFGGGIAAHMFLLFDGGQELNSNTRTKPDEGLAN